ncbi:actin filament organization protein-like protein App1-like protein [Mytilinidion resinicola]|uniref:Actin filament organization protein-like protein App1-like protein n=1 Tax=Mytilinidion resinicola TaxID=574789 RepID=A0A6A6Z5K2_9PEZI|nr:actin filament organization protein-like protein App1-like protein [Mytilinidion resinicola]KAF2816108.1 actin filament organization protein-like protein App1-like protein [Mytilinidion resinicola]
MGPESMAAMAGQARQRMQQNEEDRETRSLGGFAEIEAAMPALTSRFQFSLKDNLSSYLGSKNPFYSYVDPEEHKVWVFNNTAYELNGEAGDWQAEFVAAIFLKGSGKDISKVVADIAEKIGLAGNEEAEKTIAKRLEPFLDAIVPAHAVNINFLGNDKIRLGPSGRNGVSSDVITLPQGQYQDGQVSTSSAIKADAKDFETVFASPKGWAVISDIDDTIKKTLTSSAVGILKTTFAEEPEAIAGMPELYKHIVEKLDVPPFFYLSASPYNLYPFLHDFRSTYYPPGTMILRDASWMNLAGLLTDLTQGTQAYKTDRIEKIHGWLPTRKFVCLGDNTQTDPESYAEMYRKYPGWIGAIYIRKVTGVAEMDESKKNSSERFEKAFKDVPQDVWYVFEDANELYAKVDTLVSA